MQIMEFIETYSDAGRMMPGVYHISSNDKEPQSSQALVIGMCSYGKKFHNLHRVRHDVYRITEFLSRGGYAVHLIFDVEYNRLKVELDEFVTKFGSTNGSIFIYLAGHGGNDNKEYVFVSREDSDFGYIKIAEFIDKMQSANVFLCVDTCILDPIDSKRGSSILNEITDTDEIIQQLRDAHQPKNLFVRIATQDEINDSIDDKEHGMLVSEIVALENEFIEGDMRGDKIVVSSNKLPVETYPENPRHYTLFSTSSFEKIKYLIIEGKIEKSHIQAIQKKMTNIRSRNVKSLTIRRWNWFVQAIDHDRCSQASEAAKALDAFEMAQARGENNFFESSLWKSMESHTWAVPNSDNANRIINHMKLNKYIDEINTIMHSLSYDNSLEYIQIIDNIIDNLLTLYNSMLSDKELYLDIKKMNIFLSGLIVLTQKYILAHALYGKIIRVIEDINSRRFPGLRDFSESVVWMSTLMEVAEFREKAISVEKSNELSEEYKELSEKSNELSEEYKELSEKYNSLRRSYDAQIRRNTYLEDHYKAYSQTSQHKDAEIDTLNQKQQTLIRLLQKSLRRSQRRHTRIRGLTAMVLSQALMIRQLSSLRGLIVTGLYQAHLIDQLRAEQRRLRRILSSSRHRAQRRLKRINQLNSALRQINDHPVVMLARDSRVCMRLIVVLITVIVALILLPLSRAERVLYVLVAWGGYPALELLCYAIRARTKWVSGVSLLGALSGGTYGLLIIAIALVSARSATENYTPSLLFAVPGLLIILISTISGMLSSKIKR